ncbi:CopG family ribbon-helix-helix protein [Desulfolutivibrio sp.]|uniref:CopG family ribbon-helix-helix protein n=1 Tax=Desulfolutivibrio sp. TaxID=2773296 RepID=UPI002F969318
MANLPTTVRMDEDMVARLDGLARASGRSRAWIIKDALSRYLDYEVWFAREVEKGRMDAAQGRTLSHDEVKDRMRRRGIHVD